MKLVDILSVLLLLLSAAAFTAGVSALGERKDLMAMYWLAIGALVLRASTDMMRPKRGAR